MLRKENGWLIKVRRMFAILMYKAHANTKLIVVEQYRLLESWIKIVQEVDQNTGQPICNTTTCPVMSAGG